jgi:hypothetical protein
MPQRNRSRQFTGGPQGDDAWVLVLIPTLGELRSNQKLIKTLGRESDEAEEAARKYLAAHTLQWNWVDDEGKAFPSPHKNHEIFGELTNEEMRFIANAMNGAAGESIEESKKLKKPS